MSAPLTNYAEVSIPTVDDDEDTWGGINNGAHAAWDRALGGRLAITTTGGTTILTAEQGQNGLIVVFGELTSNAVIRVPAGRNRQYRIYNATTGDFTLTILTVGGTQGIVVPRECYQIVAANNVIVVSVAPATSWSGGFRNSTRHLNGYDGPGLFFESDPSLGLARRGEGVLGVGLLASAAGDQVRFNGANTNAAPLIGMAPSGAGPWTAGLRTFIDGSTRALAFITEATQRGYFRNGFVVGLPTGFDKGAGTINAQNGVFVNDVRALAPVALPDVEIPSATVAIDHGLSARPRYLDAVLVCLTPQYGYAVNDEAQIRELASTSTPVSLTTWRNATQVGLAKPSGAPLRVNDRSTGAVSAITPANWRLRFYVAL